MCLKIDLATFLGSHESVRGIQSSENIRNPSRTIRVAQVSGHISVADRSCLRKANDEYEATAI